MKSRLHILAIALFTVSMAFAAPLMAKSGVAPETPAISAQMPFQTPAATMTMDKVDMFRMLSGIPANADLNAVHVFVISEEHPDAPVYMVSVSNSERSLSINMPPATMVISVRLTESGVQVMQAESNHTQGWVHYSIVPQK